MKNLRNYLIIPVLFMFLYSCTEWDNFDAPNSGIYGKIIDSGTGEPLEVKGNGGGSVRLLQQDPKYATPSPIDVIIADNGTYKHTMLFAGTYKAFPWDGAFKYTANDSVTVVAKSGDLTELNFQVAPYFRIAASVTDSTFTYTITKPATTTEKMQEIIFMVNNYPIVNESVSSNTTGVYINLWKQSVSSVLDTDIIGVQRTFTFNWSTTHLPKGEYYFRVGARTSVAKYNYSPVVKAVVH